MTKLWTPTQHSQLSVLVSDDEVDPELAIAAADSDPTAGPGPDIDADDPIAVAHSPSNASVSEGLTQAQSSNVVHGGAAGRAALAARCHGQGQIRALSSTQEALVAVGLSVRAAHWRVHVQTRELLEATGSASSSTAAASTGARSSRHDLKCVVARNAFCPVKFALVAERLTARGAHGVEDGQAGEVAARTRLRAHRSHIVSRGERRGSSRVRNWSSIPTKRILGGQLQHHLPSDTMTHKLLVGRSITRGDNGSRIVSTLTESVHDSMFVLNLGVHVAELADPPGRVASLSIGAGDRCRASALLGRHRVQVVRLAKQRR
ncbi:hypothetical protein ON010_g2308 [Phytophthora cinnamomi]|nr:hypothetical protein ON010_g2308 [Phytophthora cinnamomi]